MSMTVPVTQCISTGATIFDTKRTMSFYIPLKFQAEPPTPTNTDLCIEERLPMTAYVRTFSGYAEETDWWEHIYVLHADMLRNGVNTANIDLKSFLTAGYDSPFHLINRRNEVWLTTPLTPTTKTDA
uniref:Heme-binding protein 2-like n=1 Tax=Phallusia mammillata TaxID=59560 RepID=A0A6F9DEL7_9ASCI|nr:heme-binding protein 2-like [Phallusia mammillata]